MRRLKADRESRLWKFLDRAWRGRRAGRNLILWEAKAGGERIVWTS